MDAQQTQQPGSRFHSSWLSWLGPAEMASQALSQTISWQIQTPLPITLTSDGIAEIMSECTASNDAARTSATEPNRSAIVLTDNGGDTWVLRTCALLHSGCIFKSNVSKDTSVVIPAAGHFNRCHPSWGIHSVSFLRPSVPPGLVVAQVAPSLMRNLEHSTLQGIRSSSMT